MNCASAPLIFALTLGVKPVMVTGSSAIMSTLHLAGARAAAPESARPVSAIDIARRRIAGSLARIPLTLTHHGGHRRDLAALDERITTDAHPDHVHRRRRQSAIQAAVQHEGGRPEEVHQVIKRGLRLESSR